jgi:hypothetical protein
MDTFGRSDQRLSIGGIVELQRALATRLAESVQELQAGPVPEIDAMLKELTAAATESVPGAQHAGITVATRRGTVETVSSTHPLAAVLDDIQRRHSEGPCLSAAWDEQIIRIDDMAAEGRWPRYRRDALAQTPIRSVLSFRLFLERKAMGALNFYADSPHAFPEDAVAVGLLWASHTSLAWKMTERDQQYRAALQSRDIIGQAKGVAMERFDIGADQAFDMLKRLSQESNTPLAAIAERVVLSRGRP